MFSLITKYSTFAGIFKLIFLVIIFIVILVLSYLVTSECAAAGRQRKGMGPCGSRTGTGYASRSMGR